jgi:hypothetical protein
LAHFLLIGLALFVIYDVVGDPQIEREARIVITVQDQLQLAAVWQKQWQRPPTERELQGLVQARIREEVLYREAKAMGLDEGDTIIRRRLAQKLEFLSQDLATAAEPSEQELADFLADDPDRFLVPARLTFSHVYVSVDRRGPAAEQDSVEMLGRLRAGADPAGLGDRFMLQRRYAQHTEREIGQLFGSGFAARLVELEPGRWQGPVPSGYGLHLVRIEERISSREPMLDEVRQRVRDELLAQRRREANEAMVARLREKYAIVVQRLGEDEAGSGSTAAVPGSS